MDGFISKNGFYIKKIISYDEYLNYKNMWSNIRELTKEDFINYYLIIIINKDSGLNYPYYISKTIIEDDLLNLYINHNNVEVENLKSAIASGIVYITPNWNDFNENNINIIYGE